jgi:hypothetical protein
LASNGKHPEGHINRRGGVRTEVEPLEIRGFTSLDHMTLLSRSGWIIDASKTGFLLHINRKDLVPRQFREALSVDELTGDQVILLIDKMNLEIGGKIARSQRVSKDLYEIAIDFSDDAPEYWRECLLELLPKSGDFSD